MAEFKFENLNPKGKKVGDCVIRAIAKAENKTWFEVFDVLTKVARENFSVLNDQCVYVKYLEKYRKIDVKYVDCKTGKNKRYTVNDVSYFPGTYLIQVSGHMTTVVDGVIYDIWDTSERSAYRIWRVI